MMDVMLANVPLWTQFLAFFFIIICVLLILLVLLQKGRGGGLAAAFGGAGGQSAFGSKTGDVLTWVTIAAAACFMIFAIVLTMNYVPKAPEEYIPTMTAPAGSEAIPAADVTSDETTADVAGAATGAMEIPAAEDMGVVDDASGAASDTAAEVPIDADEAAN